MHVETVLWSRDAGLSREDRDLLCKTDALGIPKPTVLSPWQFATKLHCPLHVKTNRIFPSPLSISSTILDLVVRVGGRDVTSRADRIEYGRRHDNLLFISICSAGPE